MFAFFQEQNGNRVQDGGEGGMRAAVTLAFNRNSFSPAREANQVCYMASFEACEEWS